MCRFVEEQKLVEVYDEVRWDSNAERLLLRMLALGGARVGALSFLGGAEAREMALSLKNSVHGSLLGLAVCDAVGTAVEFMPPGSFEEVTDMIGGGKFSLQPGQVSPPISNFAWILEFVGGCM